MDRCQDPNEDPNPPDVVELYPDGSVPEVRTGKLSSLCSLGLTPRLTTGAIIQLLHQHFVDPNNVINSYLREALQDRGAWAPGPESGIYIESSSKWSPESMEARPAIVVKAGDWTYQRVGINDFLGEDARSGQQYFAGYWYGSHTMFAIGNEGAETELLAAEVAKVLLWYGATICDQLGLHRFVPVKIGTLSALKESTEHYVSPVVFATVAEESWVTQEDAPRLKRIVFDIGEMLWH